MPNSQMLKQLTICSLTTLMCTAGPSVFAHTGVQQPATAGTTSYNAFTITHGCGGDIGTTPLKVRGQSTVFPYGAAVWNELQPGGVEVPIPTGGAGIVSDDNFITLSVGGIQDDDPFHTQEEETDDLENVRALNWKGGPGLKTNLVGTPRFRVTLPIILDNCVKILRVRIAAANWCEKNKNEANDANNNRADWWFTGPAKTGSALFVDTDLVQDTFWTTLTVNNPGNPDVPACAGPEREVAVQPTGTDIDTYLPYKPFTKDPGPY